MTNINEKIQNWCSNCQLRDFDLKTGINCSLTVAKPKFSTFCPDIALDVEQAKANDREYIYKKYNGIVPSVNLTKLNFWRQLLYKRELLKEEIIIESMFEQMKGSLIFVLSFFTILVIWNYKFLSVWTLLIAFIYLTLMVGIITYGKMVKGKGKIILILNNKGIQLSESTFYKWDEIQTFLKYVSNSKYLLIIKKPLETEKVIELNTWKVSVTKIECLIEKYKQEL